jgi:hypothetical protein
VPADDPWHTALHVAARDGKVELARTLLEPGANPCLTSAAAQAAVEGRLPGGSRAQAHPRGPGFNPPLQILAGIFARKGERVLYHPKHPLNLLWEAFYAHTGNQS